MRVGGVGGGGVVKAITRTASAVKNDTKCKIRGGGGPGGGQKSSKKVSCII
jgi:hypothetical protein